MARYVETKVTLTAGQAAGTDPILAAETGTIGVRSAVIVGNPTAKTLNLHLSTGQTHGPGLPLAGYNTAAFAKALPGVDNALFVTGGAAGDKITLWVA